MKKRFNLKHYTAYLFASIFLFLLNTCNTKKIEKIGENEYYVCSMDPQIMEKQMGMCPICKMPLTKTTIDKSQLNTIKLNEVQIQLGNIRVDTIKASLIGTEQTLTGIFSINQNNTEQISSRINGRIEQLYFKIIGEQVKKGDKLYDLYSRELLLAQEEYLLAFEKSKLLSLGGENIITASKNKLLLWGLNEDQIEKIAQTKQTQITNTIYSPASGAITEIPLKEGDYVNEGTKIYKLANLNTLWVEAQLYTNELQYLDAGKNVEIIPESYPNERINGVVTFVNPELQEQSTVNLIRIEIDNKRNLFKAGMPAYVLLKSNEKKTMVLPLDAVLQEREYNVIWVQIKKGVFEARNVTIGIQNKNKIEIISGVKEGEAVVTSGAYLINSEFVFKRGTTPMQNKNMKM